MTTRYLISACLAGRQCRYDGKANLQPELKALYERGGAILVCPEELGGLPTPRPPAEIIKTEAGRKVVTQSGEDVTAAFECGAQRCLAIAKENNITHAILKAKSPSCGHGVIYDGNFTRTLKPGNGLTTELLLQHGIKVFDEAHFPADEENS